jgi:hypothetical protein
MVHFIGFHLLSVIPLLSVTIMDNDPSLSLIMVEEGGTYETNI